MTEPYKPCYDCCVEAIDGGWELHVWNVLDGTIHEKVSLSRHYHTHGSAHAYGRRRVALHERHRFGEYVEEIKEARRRAAAIAASEAAKAKRMAKPRHQKESRAARKARLAKRPRARELEAQR